MRKVVVTGGSSGIGLATAKQFCKEGDQVLIVARTKQNLEKSIAEVEALNLPGSIQYFSADCADSQDIDSLVDFITNTFGGCDVLVNNAGIFVPGALHSEDEDNFELMVNVNLKSAYLLTKRLYPLLLKSNKADIVNVSSIAAITAYPNGGSYAIAKAGLLAFSNNLREELKEQNVRVTAILPGATYTNSWAGVEVEENRLMPPDDIADCIFMACNLSRRSVVEQMIVRPQLGDL